PPAFLRELVVQEHLARHPLRQGERGLVAGAQVTVDQELGELGDGCFGSGWSSSLLTRSSSGFIPARNFFRSCPEKSDSTDSAACTDPGRGTWNDHPVITR